MRHQYTALLVFVAASVCSSQTLPKVAAGTIERLDSFHSRFISDRRVDIWLPRNYSAARRYDVVYMHDGQMLFDGTTTWNGQEWGVDEVLDSLVSNGRIRDCIVVGIWNVSSQRHREYMPQKPFESLCDSQRASILGSVQNATTSVFAGPVFSDDYIRFIVQELKPRIDSLYSTNADRDHTFIMGSSMGGLISL